jgi:hypothetical protein
MSQVHFEGIDARQPDRDPLLALLHPDRVGITD